MEILNRYRSRLTAFEYPNINSLDDEQIADIFSAENRFFLLTWLSKKINSNFEDQVEWSAKAIAVFADFFCDSGFCTSSQKHAFVKADASLEIKEQIQIFDRIFEFLKYRVDQKENVQPHEDNTNIVHDLDEFLKKDMNLFPQYGPLKLRNSETLQKKKEFYKQEIAKLKENINDNESDNVDNKFNFQTFQQYNEEWKENSIEGIKNHAIKLKTAASSNFERPKRVTQENGFKPDFANQILKCNAEVANIIKYFESIRLSQHINNQDAKYVDCFEENDIHEIVREHAQVTSEIIKAAKIDKDLCKH